MIMMIRRRGGGEGVSRLDLRWEYWIWNGVEHANLQCAVMSRMMMMMFDSDYDGEDKGKKFKKWTMMKIDLLRSTRPKPAYGRQGLDWIVGPGYSFVVFSTNETMETHQKP